MKKGGNSPDNSPGNPPIVIQFPGGGDPYSDRFCPALVATGAIVRQGDYSGSWLRDNFKDADFVHFHWPSFYYSAPTSRLALARALKFTAILAWARLRGVRVLWTAHNLYPHEKISPSWLAYVMRKVVVALSHRIFVHGPSARALLAREFSIDQKRLVTVTHGHFCDGYPMSMTREEARRQLGIPPASKVLAFVGMCRRYKNLAYLVREYKRALPDAWLIIAGKFRERDYQSEIEGMLGDVAGRVVFAPRFIEDAELQVFIRAADAIVLPFRDVLTSGSAILALSFGRPVVAPRMGYLRDMIDEQTGVLYDPADPDGLVNAMRAALTKTFDEQAIDRHVRALRWEDAAQPVMDAMRQP
jgi:glycosyltransferase involved in cell wall biosynthesis